MADAVHHPSPQTAPRFDVAERDRRYAVVRRLMRERALDCLIIPHNTGEWDNYQSDTRYLTCIGGGGAATALVFPFDGEPVVIVREARRVDWWRAQQDWVSDVRAPKNFSWAGVFEDALNERKLGSSKIGVVGLRDVLRDAEGTASYGEIAHLTRVFPKASFESGIDVLNRARKRKSRAELVMMRRAQSCAEAMSEALHAVARTGASEHAVYADVVAAHIRAGGEVPTMILFDADTRLWQTQLLPRFRLLQQDDLVVLEAEAKFFGYIAQAIDTVALRPLTSTEKRLFEISKACFDEILAAMRPGVSYADLIALWDKSANRDGCLAGRTMGHGLGLGQDGPLTTRGGKAGGLVVEDGDCFVLKPWVDDPSRTISARVGGNVVVEEGHAVVLGQPKLECFLSA